jgi:hypothetical protein
MNLLYWEGNKRLMKTVPEMSRSDRPASVRLLEGDGSKVLLAPKS